MWVLLISGISLFTRLNLKDCLECGIKATEREGPEEEQSGVRRTPRAGGTRGRWGPTGSERAVAAQAGPAGVACLSGGRRCPRVPRRAPPAPRYL